MADSTSFDQSKQGQSSKVAVSHPSHDAMGKNPKKSLVNANVFSFKDLLTEFGEAFPNINHLDANDFPSKYKQSILDLVASLFGINKPYKALAPKPTDRARFPKPGCLRIYKETFYSRFCLPPPPFVYRLLSEVRVCPTQLQPKGWRVIYCFLVQCRKHNIEPSVSVFHYFFKVSNSTDNWGLGLDST